MTYAVTADELRSFVERLEQNDAERKAIFDYRKEIKAEAKSRGYSVRELDQLVKLRRMKPDDLAQQEAVLELYRSALGMA